MGNKGAGPELVDGGAKLPQYYYPMTLSSSRRRWFTIGRHPAIQRHAYIAVLILAAAACGGDNVSSPRFADPEGRIAFLTGGGAGNLQIVMSRTNGSGQTRVLKDDNHYGPVAWAPSGDRIAFHSNRDNAGGLDLFISDSDGKNLARVVGGPGREESPDWSPDGARLAFSSDRDGGTYGVFVSNTSGADIRRISPPGVDARHPDWHPSGLQIAFRAENSQGGTDLALINIDGTGYTMLLGGTGHRHEAPRWSPEGSVIAFHSNRHLDDPQADAAFRQYEVYTIRVSDGVTRRLTQGSSADRAHLEPNWSPDGTRMVAESRAVQERYTRIEHRMFIMDAGGGGARQIRNDTRSRFPRWSP